MKALDRRKGSPFIAHLARSKERRQQGGSMTEVREIYLTPKSDLKLTQPPQEAGKCRGKHPSTPNLTRLSRKGSKTGPKKIITRARAPFFSGVLVFPIFDLFVFSF